MIVDKHLDLCSWFDYPLWSSTISCSRVSLNCLLRAYPFGGAIRLFHQAFRVTIWRITGSHPLSYAHSEKKLINWHRLCLFHPIVSAYPRQYLLLLLCAAIPHMHCELLQASYRYTLTDNISSWAKCARIFMLIFITMTIPPRSVTRYLLEYRCYPQIRCV